MVLREEKGSALTHKELDQNFKEANESAFLKGAQKHDLTNSMDLNVTYTNELEVAKIVSIGIEPSYKCVLRLYVDNEVQYRGSHDTTSQTNEDGFIIVPPKSTYMATSDKNKIKWIETF